MSLEIRELEALRAELEEKLKSAEMARWNTQPEDASSARP